MENFEPLKKLGENYEPTAKIGIPELEIEPPTPRLRRSDSVLCNTMTEHEQALFDNFMEGEDGDTPEIQKFQRLKNREFLHLQDGILGVSYQAEELHKRTLAKTAEVVTILQALCKKLDSHMLKLDEKRYYASRNRK